MKTSQTLGSFVPSAVMCAHVSTLMSVHVQRVNLYDHVHSSRLVSLMGKLALLLTYMLVKTQGGAVCVSLYVCVCVYSHPYITVLAYICQSRHTQLRPLHNTIP